MEYYAQVIDANINRVAEGLRVIEEYTRFISKNKALTDALAAMRKQLNLSETNPINNLKIRDTFSDMRAKEVPSQRPELWDLLKANFKRVEEGLRVLEEYTGNPLYNSLRYDAYELEKEVLLSLTKKNIKPGIYLISDQIEILEEGLKKGVSLIQLRDKKSDKPSLLSRSQHMQALAKGYNTPFIINDHLDIALEIDADGFHSGQDDLSVTIQRRLLGPHKIIGKTTHNLEQGLQAQQDGADYVSVGPIWETPSKPGRAGIGFEYLKQASQLRIPFVAIGGVSLDNIDQILPYQPPLIGVIRAFDQLEILLARIS